MKGEENKEARVCLKDNRRLSIIKVPIISELRLEIVCYEKDKNGIAKKL